MTESKDWHASLIELRIAWVVAACCIALIFTASARPDWFEFPASISEPQAQLASIEKPKVKPAPRPKKVEPVKQAPQTEKPAAISQAKPKPVTSPKAPTAIVKSEISAAKASAIATGYYVQIGAFKERPRAQGLADQLKRQSWDTVIVEKKNGLHAVWIGPKQNRGEAETLLKTIDRQLKRTGFIIHQKKI